MSIDLNSKIATQVAAIPRSGIRDFFELVQGRDDVISLGVGEPDFSAPWHIREAAIYSLEQGETSYTSNLGLLSLRKSISKYVTRQFDVTYDPEKEVLVTVGVSEALDLACRALLNPGDEVIYHEPCYVSYSPSIIMAYGKAVAIQTKVEDEFILKAEDVAAAITDKTRVIMLNFPTNPTGAVEPIEELEKIAKLAIEHDLIVISDEIYSELTYTGDDGMSRIDHISIASLPDMRERTILLHGFSKAYAMTGFRLGYACAPNILTEAMMKIHQYSMLCAPIMSQKAAIEALENGDAEMENMRKAYAQRRNLLLKRFKEMGVPCFSPGGAFYAFPDIRKFGLSSHDFAMKLLEEESVAVVPGTAFGKAGEGCVRACYATAYDKLEIALDRIEAFVGRL
ncbi:aminotransferase class I/II-fold pyridoxal phosphate-dependent enzyme [Verrucomicrobiales bacterium]|nr:aminotransferase class I/II-fold pyridoxal phosphate-dependent enzyme [bacterium]MDB4662111.1 aminotransferase class I/II-fold pyridoxal phosphate-dependent enzyme [Verrucomicrobiales bacterium]MDC0321781.1 aminotransferase class I/II-fold pyridoxal phosphate-dependent enzyme [Verrucomicrobiales bacterium]